MSILTAHHLRGLDIPDVVSVLGKFLTTEWKRVKTPYGLSSSFDKVNSSHAEDLERILLDAGFKVWLSYFLAGRVRGTHYSGQLQDQTAIEVLRGWSPERQREVAEQLNNTEVHPSVSNAIDALWKRCNEGRE